MGERLPYRRCSVCDWDGDGTLYMDPWPPFKMWCTVHSWRSDHFPDLGAPLRPYPSRARTTIRKALAKGLKPPGWDTGLRSSAAESRAYLSLWHARPGDRFIDADMRVWRVKSTPARVPLDPNRWVLTVAPDNTPDDSTVADVTYALPGYHILGLAHGRRS